MAVLNGDGRLAASVALLALHQAGVVKLCDTTATSQHLALSNLTGDVPAAHRVGIEVIQAGPLAAGADPVEADVYAAVLSSSSLRPADIRAAGADFLAVTAVRNHLIGRGLLRPSADRDRCRRRCLWFVPVLLLGLVRLGFGGNRCSTWWRSWP